jgi:hypothetical protein
MHTHTHTHNIMIKLATFAEKSGGRQPGRNYLGWRNNSDSLEWVGEGES